MFVCIFQNWAVRFIDGEFRISDFLHHIFAVSEVLALDSSSLPVAGWLGLGSAASPMVTRRGSSVTKRCGLGSVMALYCVIPTCVSSHAVSKA
jgi:hypothetical protein